MAFYSMLYLVHRSWGDEHIGQLWLILFPPICRSWLILFPVQECQNIQEILYYDAKRRYQLGQGVPEPEEQQILVVRKLMSGEMEVAKANNQIITRLDLERQAKERELEVLRYVLCDVTSRSSRVSFS